MRKLIHYTIFLLLPFLSSSVSAQQITGKVVDNIDGLPVPGVNVSAVGFDISTVTDFDGNFTINASAGTRLKISMIGYETVTVTGYSNVTIRLVASNKVLEEVVVVGYGTKKKGAVTGSVSQIKSEDILRSPAKSAIQSIQGKATGVNIVANDEPGANPTITIRGLGSVTGNINPLYVIDGLEAGSLNGLSSNDIETIDILKDASSLAIYGQKGANGVILITTKRGKKGDVKVSYDSYYGQKTILKKVKLADSYRYAYFNNTALGSSSYYNFNQPVNTNWLDEITRTGEVSNNSVSFSGASDNINYYLGVTHYTEKGILIGTDYKRSNVISKNEFKFSDKFKVSQSINISVANNTPQPLNAFTSAYKQSPIVPVRYPNGQFGAPLVNTVTGLNDTTGQVMNNVGNPVAQLYYHHEKNRNVTIFGSIGAELQLIKDLKFNSNFGATADWGKGYTFTPNQEIGLAQNPSLNAQQYAAIHPTDPVNTLEQRRSDFYEWNWDNYFTFKKNIGSHDFTLVAGMSRTTKHDSEVLNARRVNVPVKSNYWFLDFSESNENILPDNYITNNRETPIVSIAYFARLEYAFNSKYLISGSVRREGISVFQSGKKWAFFPAVSAGWVISKEAFVAESKIINFLKIRGGYGEVGNGNAPANNDILFTSGSYPFGGISQPGTNVANAVDPNLTWETVKEVDLGVDFTLFNNHISGTLDFYNRKSDDLILPVAPPYVLSENKTAINTGEVTNKGYEVSLRWNDSMGQFKYWFGGNFSENNNEVSRIDSSFFNNYIGGSTDNGKYTKLVTLGAPLGSFYVFQQTGYNADGAPVYNDMVDGVAGLTDEDRVNAGSYIPKYTYGLNIGATYKNVDFSVEGYGVGGNKIYNGKKAQRFGGENIEYDILDDFWTPSTPNAANPRPSNEIPTPSTYFIEDGAYFRINNITIGYTFPKMIKKVDRVRLYLTALNPFMFTKYSGYSPEIAGEPLGKAGIELDAYPTNKSFLVGANISF